MRFAAYLFILALAACQQQCPTAVIAVKDWTPVEQRRMADEIDPLPEDSILPAVIEDYTRLRREVR